ncbi:MAG: hypothetical protein ACHQ1G_04700 [Planctomycetota bacterium]
MAAVRRFRWFLAFAAAAALLIVLLLVFRGKDGSPRAWPRGQENHETAAVPPLPEDAALPRSGDDPEDSPEARAEEKKEGSARDRLLAWVFDANGRVCCATPETYFENLWNVQVYQVRERVPDAVVTGVFSPTFGVDDWLARMPDGVTLHGMDLRMSDVTARGLGVLAGRKDLRVLVILGCPGLRCEDLNVVATLPSLEILVVKGVNLDDRALSFIADARNLRRLELSGRGITDAGVPRLLGLPRIEQLDLSDTGISRASLPLLARMSALSRLSVANRTLVSRAEIDAAR